MISITCFALWGEYRHHQGYHQAYNEIDYKLSEIIKDKKTASIKGLSHKFYPRKDKAVIAGAGDTTLQTGFANKHKRRK